jgi:hypothetical protein
MTADPPARGLLGFIRDLVTSPEQMVCGARKCRAVFAAAARIRSAMYIV